MAGPETQPRIIRLRLTDFRSYSTLDQAVDSPLVALCGPNGAGKTNILEAISLLSPGRGLRRAQGTSLPRKDGRGGYAIITDLASPTGEILLATALVAGEAQRQCRIDREPVASANRFLDHLAFLWLTPDQDGLFRGAAGDRRRFLDRLVLAVDKSHGTRANAYEHALRHRNRLLEDFDTAPRWLDAIEQEIAELGVALAAARLETVSRLSALAAADAEAMAPFPHAIIALEGELESHLATDSALKVEDWFRAALRDGRARDRGAGRALVGPQVSDLAVIHGPKGEPAAQCSTGEQKALLLGLVLAQAKLIGQMRGEAPVLLLDEIAAHLDAERRHALFAILRALGGQVFMTGTDRLLFEGLGAENRILSVVGGKVFDVAVA
ncbi:MAG: DNA replication/repair protein RecF [Rhizobiales bacterium PAR1]|nr:MAG: DNA replication/repair protein RecF [Rhizobiales bacterium PAR1]